MLTKATLKDGRVINISYDAQGRLRHRTKGAIYHDYTYDQDRLLQLDTNFGGDPATLTFLYDSQGVQGFTYNNRVYHYVKNLFGDVTDIYCGSTRIVHYIYDALGNYKLSHTFDDLSWIGNCLIGDVNPFKYRSQLYDEELGFYYIQGRYYDPQVGRFISPARVSNLNPQAINGLNLYSYAGNNPISIQYRDSTASQNRITGIRGSVVNSSSATYCAPNINSASSSFLYDILGFASNLFGLLNGVEVAEYLTQIRGNPPKVSWFLKNLSKAEKISSCLGFIAAGVDGVSVYLDTNDAEMAVFTTLYDIGSMLISSKIGMLLGSLIGGPVGAIVGTLIGIGIDTLLQCCKEDVVEWLDRTVDDIRNWISNTWRRLVNA